MPTNLSNLDYAPSIKEQLQQEREQEARRQMAKLAETIFVLLFGACLGGAAVIAVVDARRANEVRNLAKQCEDRYPGRGRIAYDKRQDAFTCMETKPAIGAFK